MKNSSDTIGNLTRDLPACSAVPQPTALPRVPNVGKVRKIIPCRLIARLRPLSLWVWHARVEIAPVGFFYS